MSQIAYDVPARAFAGMLADAAPHDIRSLVNEEAVDVPFGIVVVEGTTETEFKLPTSAADKVAGFLVHSHAIDNRGIDTQQNVPADKMASILRWGYIYLVPELAVTKGDPVFYRISNGVSDATETQKGSCTNIDDSGTAVRLNGARWAADGAKDVPTMVEVKGMLGESTPSMIRADHIQVTADTTQFLFQTDADRAFLLEEAVYYNATGLANDATNFFDIQVKHGTTVAANWSTETGQEGAIAADTPVVLTNGADLVIPPGTRVNLFLDEDGTATLPAGTIQVTGRYL